MHASSFPAPCSWKFFLFAAPFWSSFSCLHSSVWPLQCSFLLWCDCCRRSETQRKGIVAVCVIHANSQIPVVKRDAAVCLCSERVCWLVCFHGRSKEAIQRSLDSDGTDYATYERAVDVHTLESFPVKFTPIGYMTLMVSEKATRAPANVQSRNPELEVPLRSCSSPKQNRH